MYDIFRVDILKTCMRESLLTWRYVTKMEWTTECLRTCCIKADNFQVTHLDTSNFTSLWISLPNFWIRLQRKTYSHHDILAESWDHNLCTILAQIKQPMMYEVPWQCHWVPHFKSKPYWSVVQTLIKRRFCLPEQSAHSNHPFLTLFPQPSARTLPKTVIGIGLGSKK